MSNLIEGGIDNGILVFQFQRINITVKHSNIFDLDCDVRGWARTEYVLNVE